jgi:hypothetical protein
MKRMFQDFPGWSFDIDEISAGVYHVIAIDEQGHQIFKTGIDPDTLIAECKSEASDIRRNSSISRPKFRD